MPYMAAVENVIGSLFCRAGSMVGEAISSTLQVLRCTELSFEGHSLPKFDVRLKSALHPIAIKSRTSRHFGFGPKADQGAPRQMTSLFDHLVGAVN
jgi:hypothetical protein